MPPSGHRDLHRIAFLSSNDVWGGSEELWRRTASLLATRGHSVLVGKQRAEARDPTVRSLVAAGCQVIDLRGRRAVPRKVRSLASMIWSLSRRLMERRILAGFRAGRPALAVISQGLNYDGWWMGAVCRREGVPYVIVSHKASDLYWPPDGVREELCGVYRAAHAALFVSDHNRQLTEEQLGFRLPHARIVRNPHNAAAEPPAWPEPRGVWQIACLARQDAREKGQDLLLRVLADPKWRARPLHVSLFGAGHNADGLRAMADLLDLPHVAFRGFHDDPASIWAQYHALILPSRCEGLPLTLIEAMLAARPVIATDVGGNREAIRDGVTGFLAEAATEAALDRAMEAAWSRRAEWRAMGVAARQHALALVPPDPIGTFAADLLSLIETLRRE